MKTKEPQTPEAVIYVRVASVDANDRDSKVATQEQRCRDYADAQGYVVTRVFTDAAISGSTADRPGLNAMLRYLKTMRDRETIVVMDDCARLARDIHMMVGLTSSIRDTGARLEFCNEKGATSITVPAQILFKGMRRAQL